MAGVVQGFQGSVDPLNQVKSNQAVAKSDCDHLTRERFKTC